MFDLSTVIIDIFYSFKVEDKDKGYTYTYNPCYPFTVGSGCTNVAVSYMHITDTAIYRSLGNIRLR